MFIADSFSAIVFQAHGAAAYGADGIDYFCWSFEGNGIWNNSNILHTPPEAVGGAPPVGKLNPANYAGAKRANGNLRAWGPDLQAFSNLAAVFYTGAWNVTGVFTAFPSAASPILTTMADDISYSA